MSRILFAAKKRLDGTTHEQSVICRQLFAGHVVGSWPIKRKTKMHRMIIIVMHLETEINSHLSFQLHLSLFQSVFQFNILQPNLKR